MIISYDSGSTKWLFVESVARGGNKILPLKTATGIYTRILIKQNPGIYSQLRNIT
jgi:hypothetical protein